MRMRLPIVLVAVVFLLAALGIGKHPYGILNDPAERNVVPGGARQIPFSVSFRHL